MFSLTCAHGHAQSILPLKHRERQVLAVEFVRIWVLAWWGRDHDVRVALKMLPDSCLSIPKESVIKEGGHCSLASLITNRENTVSQVNPRRQDGPFPLPYPWGARQWAAMKVLAVSFVEQIITHPLTQHRIRRHGTADVARTHLTGRELSFGHNKLVHVLPLFKSLELSCWNLEKAPGEDRAIARFAAQAGNLQGTKVRPYFR